MTSTCSHASAAASAHAKSDVLLPTTIKPSRYQLTIVTGLTDRKFTGRVVIRLHVNQPTAAVTLHSLGLTFDASNARLIAENRKSTDSNSDSKTDIKAVAATVKNSTPPPAWSSGANATGDETALQCTGVTFDEKQQTASLAFGSHPLPIGYYRLVIVYSAPINSKLAGFYLSEYKVVGSDAPHYIGVTQFEPTDARRALPCFDEPALKATFEVTLVVPKLYEAVSNGMTVLKHETQKHDTAGDIQWPAGMMLHRFSESPIMSTYLLTWVVGEFDYVSTTTPVTECNILVRIFTPIGKSHLGQFAMRVTVGALAFFKNYFDIPYMTPKVDLLAIPDFAAGAMEGFACITYRETALLIDEEHSSAIAKQRVARTVSHELAHMWFGNLVTMQWWTHLWLNEGFARFCEFLAVNHLFPEWKIFDQFVDEVFSMALSLDGLANSHPVEVEVHHPSEINEIFDMISYAKGASVLRMIHDVIGAAQFQAGLRSYLNKYKWANARSEDLWAALSGPTAGNMDVAGLMSAWLKRTGYPLLTITEGKDSTANARTFTVAQERFLADGSIEQPLDMKSANGNRDSKGRIINRDHWMVPIHVAAVTPNTTSSSGGGSGGAGAVSILKPLQFVKGVESATITVNASTSAVLKFNANQSAFYRILYTPALLNPLLPVLKSLSAADRLGVQGDVFAAAKAGRLPITSVLTLSEYFKDESEYCVVNSLTTNLVVTAKVHADKPYFGLLQRFIRDIYTPAYQRLGWDAAKDEDHITGLFRATVLGTLSFAGHPDVISEAKSRFYKYVASPSANPIRADLKGLIYAAAVKNDVPFAGSATDKSVGTPTVSHIDHESAFRRVLQMLRATDVSAEERTRLQDAVGRTRDPIRLESAIEFCFSDEVRSQDVPLVFTSIGQNSQTGREMSWAYLKNNWKAVYARFKDAGFLIPRIVSAATAGWTDSKKADEIESFFTANPCPEADRVIKQVLESVRANATRVARESDPLNQYLTALYPVEADSAKKSK